MSAGIHVAVTVTVLDAYGTKLEVKRRKRKYLEFANVTPSAHCSRVDRPTDRRIVGCELLLV